MQLTKYTLDLLNDIENRIIPEVEEDFVDQWKTFWNGGVSDIIFTPKRKMVSPPSPELRQININDALEDYELMLDMQLAGVSEALNSSFRALSVRANYGTGILSSLFGAEIFKMSRQQNTLPTTKPLDTDRMRSIAEADIPDLNGGFGRKVFEFGEFCLEVFRNYPKIAKYVFVYHPDTQGPLDIAELMWGCEMFYEMYDDPDLVHGVMQRITDTYVRFLERWFAMYPNRRDINVHWHYWMRGGICLRNDSAINLSPDQYREFALPYDTFLLDHFGGGMVHYCGKGDHFIGLLAACESLSGINLSQPHLNDMDKVFHAAFSNGKKILDLSKSACDAYAQQPDPRRGMIFCG